MLTLAKFNYFLYIRQITNYTNNQGKSLPRSRFLVLLVVKMVVPSDQLRDQIEGINKRPVGREEGLLVSKNYNRNIRDNT